MSDEIKQVFGFDASQALESLNLLDAGFAKLEQNLQKAPAAFTAFNQGAGKTVSALIQIEQRANAAANALGRLNAIPGPAAAPGAGSGLLTGSAAAAAMDALVGGAGGSGLPVKAGLGDAAALRRELGLITSGASSAGNAVKEAGDKGANALNSARRAGSGFALSLETITRVIGTQIIVRALNSVRTAVEGSFQGFIDFNRKIAEIQTISTDSVEKLAGDVRKLSDEFNAPILDVAKAKYEILSNGFESTAESTTVLTAALKFAKVGISDVSQAADLISTSLNAYGKSADEAETISAKLFKTIELGRVVGSELATSFGRVAPIAHEVGASEDEVLAAFSSITIGGVKASEAATQIRASLTALLKPSDAMKEALHALGLETGEQAIQAFGYQGALQAVIGTTNGTTTAIAKLFPNVRAINGVLREVGTGADIFQQHLKAIQEASRELLNKKFEIRISSDAEKVATDLNKVKNFFTVELGSELVQTAAGFTAWVGGIDNVIDGMRALAPVIATGVAGLVLYNVTTLSVTGANAALEASFKRNATAAQLFGGALSSLVAFVGAFELGKFIGKQITDSINAEFDKAKEVAAQRLQFERSQAEARANIDKIETDKKFQELNQAEAEIRKLYFERVDAAKEQNQKLLEDDKATIDGIVSQHEKLAQAIRKSAEDADNDITSSRQRAGNAQAQLEDQRFNFQSKRNDVITQSLQAQQRARELAGKAALQLSTANSTEEKNAALAVFQRADSYAQIGASTAASAKNTTLQAQAEQSIEAVLQKRIDAEQQFQHARAEDAKQARQAAEDEQKRANTLKALGKEFLDNASVFGKKGEVLPEDQINENLKKAKDALTKFKEEAFGPGTKFNLQNLFDFNNLEQSLSQKLTKGQINTLKASDSALEGVRKQIQKAFDLQPFIVAITPDPSKLAGKPLDEQLTESHGQRQQRQQDLAAGTQEAIKRRDAEKQIAQAVKEAEESFNRQTPTMARLAQLASIAARDVIGSPLGPTNREQLLNQLTDVRKQIQSLLNNPGVSRQLLDSLAEKGRAIADKAPASLRLDIENANNEFEALKKIYDLRQQISAIPANSDEDVARANEFLNSDTQREAVEKLLSSTTATISANTKSAAGSTTQLRASLSASVNPSASIAENMDRAARSAASAAASSQQIGQGGQTQAQAFGGMIRHFATGGFAHSGTDTIPAMLSQGEMVINAASTSRFLPQLQAINAGIQPSFNTTNNSGDTINVGDINIHADPNPKATAQEVYDILRRAARRGTINSLS